ncbi:DUF89 domain-containing protein [candidate division CSSED10-310 bacterium]|uniref:DUF89 domain-containing protein n=1 Tax=candidate division CSSED10-310 bacterium TaxID=2855610 RepID=A0ABV6Z0R2_UNCC1
MVLSGYCCVSCIIDDVVGALLPIVENDQLRQKVLKACLRYLEEEFSLHEVPSTYITGVHRILKDITGISIPYADLRRKCNEIGMIIAEKVSQNLDSQDPFIRFEKLVRWAIAGNELDFRTVGTGYEIDVAHIEALLEECVNRPLVVNHLPEIFALVQQARRILYVPDNVGEIAFDLQLIREIKGRDKQIFFPLRGGPITSDATIEDGEFVNAAKIVSEVFKAGPDTLGISMAEKSERLTYELNQADLIICKGQANFYTFSEFKDSFPGSIVSLLRTKCDWATSYFSQSGKINIAAVLKKKAQ